MTTPGIPTPIEDDTTLVDDTLPGSFREAVLDARQALANLLSVPESWQDSQEMTEYIRALARASDHGDAPKGASAKFDELSIEIMANKNPLTENHDKRLIALL